MTRHRYLLAGRVVESDVVLSELARNSGSAEPAVRISAIEGPFQARGVTLREAGNPYAERGAIRVERYAGGLCWDVRGVGRFWLADSGDEVRYAVVEGHDPDDVEQALVGPILGTALHLQGLLALHATALAVGGVVFAVSAPSGHGKSTLAAALTRHGARLLSDDVLPLEISTDMCIALPYLPRLKLWADSLAALGLDGDDLPRVATWAEKRRIALDDEAAGDAAAGGPLAAVYLLDSTDQPVAPEIVDLPPVDAVLALQAAVYPADLLTAEQSAKALRAAADVAGLVRVRELTAPRGYDRLDEVCRALLADVAETRRTVS